MISQLRGTLIEKHPPSLVIDVNGVGYEVLAPMTSIYQLPETGKTVTLFIHMVVREDAQQLYGFVERQDRAVFRTLLRVNGVGPKMALAILSGMESADLVRCVTTKNLAPLVSIPGVGKKTAERLLVELGGRFDDTDLGSTSSIAHAAGAETGDIMREAESALVALGYKPQEAMRAITAAAKDDAATSSEALIRLALRSMVRKS